MVNLDEITLQIQTWAEQLGFSQVGFTNTDLTQYEPHFKEWLARGFHGDMAYMAENKTQRLHPEQCVPETITIISVTMNYLPPATNIIKNLQNRTKAYISRYALGGDYHKYMRKRLQKLAEKITDTIGPFGYRAFTDSAPVLEKPLAEKAGLGWIGKNTLLMNKKDGSWFFLGELFTDLPLPVNQTPQADSCKKCKACLTICPTQAIVEPYILDARRCISYLTIEHKGVIDETLRPLMGNRIYGCDDCQLICPWNRYATPSEHEQFQPRHQLDDANLLTLFAWTEQEFLQKTEGSPIRRIGFERWQRNLAIALGNAPHSKEITNALILKREICSDLVKIHIDWAIQQQQIKIPAKNYETIIRDKLAQSVKINRDY